MSLGIQERVKVGQRQLLILLVLLMLAFPLDTFISVSGLPFLRTPAALVGLVLFALFLLYKVRFPSINGGPVFAAIFFLGVTGVIEVYHLFFGHSLGFTESFTRYIQWAQVMVLFVICAELGRDHRALPWILGAFVCVICAIGLINLLQVPGLVNHHWTSAGWRVGFSGYNVNRQSFFFGLTIIVLLTFVLWRWPRPGPLGFAAGVAVIILFYLQLMSGSRGSFIVTVLGVTYLAVRLVRRRNLDLYFIIGPLVLLGLAYMFVTTGAVFDRLVGAVTEQRFSTRDEYFWTAVRLFSERPWLGYGMESYFAFGDAVGREVRAPHNGVMQVLLTYGIVGAFFWLVLLFSIARRVWAAPAHPFTEMFKALLLTCFAYHAFTDMAFDRYYWIILGLAANLALHVNMVGRPSAAGSALPRFHAGASGAAAPRWARQRSALMVGGRGDSKP